jgi:hypothetical protein
MSTLLCHLNVSVIIGCLLSFSFPIRAQTIPLWQTTEFAQYWFQGKAEVNHYKLEQNRYGEMREGHAVLVFVTEDFLPKKQVKADNSDRKVSGAIPVMKLNSIRKFITGIYDYANMTSVFTPLDNAQHPQTLKTTTSIQEWCGQTWLQANWRDNAYQVRGYSYYESEGDVDVSVPQALFEDELLTRIRLGQAQAGTYNVVMGAQDARMFHQAWTPQPAVITIKSEGEYQVLRVRYKKSPRRVKIIYEKAFPYGIDTIITLRGKEIMSRMTRTGHANTAYWNHNHEEDRLLREMLHLPMN